MRTIQFPDQTARFALNLSLKAIISCILAKLFWPFINEFRLLTKLNEVFANIVGNAENTGIYM